MLNKICWTLRSCEPVACCKLSLKKMINKLSDNYRRIVEITVKLIDRIGKKTSLCIAYDLNISVAITFLWTIFQFWLLLSSFPVMVNVNTGCFLFTKRSVDFRHFRVFVFCNRAHSKTRKPRKNFYMLIFRAIKTIYLIWSTFLSILCDQDTTLKVLLKVIE